MEENQCFLCGEDVEQRFFGEDNYHIKCPTCGDIFVNQRFLSFYVNHDKLQLSDEHRNPLGDKENEKAKSALRHYYKMHTLKNTNNSNKAIVLSTSNYQEIINSVNYPKSLLAKIDLVLEYLYSKTFSFGESVCINLNTDYPLFFCEDNNELSAILTYLEEEALINYEPYCGEFQSVKITAEGIEKIEELGKNFNSEQCFVAMWFSDETKTIWDNAIKTSVEKAGYDPIRIDELEHIENIADKIISEIRKSKFIIVDLTGDRGGVYFEAGFAYGLNLPVIYTCKEDALDNVHFDLKQQNMILWNDKEIDKFEEKLFNRIGNIIGLNEKVKVKASV